MKLYHSPDLKAAGVEMPMLESFLSSSRRGVIRGMHFQVPPHDHEKLVGCVHGRARDALLDLRVGSPTYGVTQVLELSPDRPGLLYIPRGVAHGFAALEDRTDLCYFVSSVHEPSADAGVHWASLGIDWWLGEAVQPIVSERDQRFPPWCDFSSPFTFEVGA